MLLSCRFLIWLSMGKKEMVAVVDQEKPLSIIRHQHIISSKIARSKPIYHSPDSILCNILCETGQIGLQNQHKLGNLALKIQAYGLLV